jgi:hypothetical protein
MSSLDLMLRELRLGTVVRHAKGKWPSAPSVKAGVLLAICMISSRWSCLNAASAECRNGSRNRAYP